MVYSSVQRMEGAPPKHLPNRWKNCYNNSRAMLLKLHCAYISHNDPFCRFWFSRSRMGTEIWHVCHSPRMPSTAGPWTTLRAARIWEIPFGPKVAHTKREEISSPSLRHVLISFHGHFIKSWLAPIQNSRKMKNIVYGTGCLLNLQRLHTFPFLCLRRLAVSITSSFPIYSYPSVPT